VTAAILVTLTNFAGTNSVPYVLVAAALIMLVLLAACRRGGSISSPQAEFDSSVDDKHAVINHFAVP